MKQAGIVLLAGLVLSTAGHSQQVAREWQAEVALDVDVAGQVAKVTYLNEIPEAIAKPAGAVMTHWRFKPVQKDGHTVAARTYAFVKLQVVPRDPATYGLRVVYGSNGPRLRPTASPFPLSGGLLASSPGALLIEAVVQPDGHVNQVQVIESHFTHHEHLIDSAAAKAIGQWRADPEYVDGTPIATRVQIAAVNCGTAKNDCDAYSNALKLRHRSTVPGAPAPSGGQSVALNSPLEPLSVQPGG